MFRDNSDRIVELLERIADAVGSGDDDKMENVWGGYRVTPATNLIVVETADMDGSNVNADGTITLSPGDRMNLVRFDVPDTAKVAVLGVGATDKADVEYGLQIDNGSFAGGTTQSPLGTVTSPYSFPQDLGCIVPAEKSVAYEAKYAGSASGDISLAARLVVEVP